MYLWKVKSQQSLFHNLHHHWKVNQQSLSLIQCIEHPLKWLFICPHLNQHHHHQNWPRVKHYLCQMVEQTQELSALMLVGAILAFILFLSLGALLFVIWEVINYSDYNVRILWVHCKCNVKTFWKHSKNTVVIPCHPENNQFARFSSFKRLPWFNKIVRLISFHKVFVRFS